MLTPTQRIFAGIVIGAAVGLVGTFASVIALHPESNMAPLAAFLFGAPLGAVAGALIADRKNKALMILWGLTLLATLFFTIGPKLMAPGIAAQVLCVFAAFRFQTRHRWLLAAIFMLTAVVTFFPPVTSGGQLTTGFASIFDPRLDASRHIPELTVQRWFLLIECVIAAAIAIPISRSAAKAARTAGERA